MSFIFSSSFLLGLLLFNLANALENELLLSDDLGKIEDFKYMVSVYVDGTYCGGSIIDDDLILTAAHCFYDAKSNIKKHNIKIIAGVDDLHDQRSPTRVTILAKAVYVTKKFHMNPNGKFDDIAVLKLRQPLEFNKNSNIRKIELADKEYYDEQPIVSGFGDSKVKFVRNSNGEIKILSSGGGKLRYSTTDVIPNVEFQRKWTYATLFGLIKTEVFHVEPSHICAQVFHIPTEDKDVEIKFNEELKNQRGACNGDSGNPLVVGGQILIGVLSHNDFSCSEREAPSIYTNVLYYKDFIESLRGNNIPSTKLHEEVLNEKIIRKKHPNEI